MATRWCNALKYRTLAGPLLPLQAIHLYLHAQAWDVARQTKYTTVAPEPTALKKSSRDRSLHVTLVAWLLSAGLLLLVPSHTRGWAQLGVACTETLTGAAFTCLGEAEHGLTARAQKGLQAGFSNLLRCDFHHSPRRVACTWVW